MAANATIADILIKKIDEVQDHPNPVIKTLYKGVANVLVKEVFINQYVRPLEQTK